MRIGLQWSRRVNTAECQRFGLAACHLSVASMEPPCEHGGVTSRNLAGADKASLQWSRRVNTAEWSKCAEGERDAAGKLQWSRRVNTAEWSAPRAIAPGCV